MDAIIEPLVSYERTSSTTQHRTRKPMNDDRNRGMNSCTGLAGQAGVRSCADAVAFGLAAWLPITAHNAGSTLGLRSGMKVSTK